MKELFERIIVWHEKNLPSGLPYEPLPQIGFLLEELHEVNKEFVKGDIDAAVGEITDLIVFSVNALVLLDKSEIKLIYTPSVIDRIENISATKVVINIAKYIANVISDISFMGAALEDSYVMLGRNCIRCIKSLGYSPEIALEETIKKIESRRGAWDASIGKWVKEKNQADVYVPDYSLARLS